MKVKAVTPHGNPRGESYWKEAETVYELPDAEAAGLIRAGVVEEVPAEAETPTSPADAPDAAEPKGKAGAGAPDKD